MHGQFRAAQGLGGRLDGLCQFLTAEGQDDIVLVHAAALPHIDGGDGTGSQRSQGTLGLILEVGCCNGAHPVDSSRCSLCRGQTTRIGHREGHSAGEQVARAQGIGAGHSGNSAGQHLKSTVQRHLGGLPYREVSSIRSRELQHQIHLGAVPHHGHFLTALYLIALVHLQAADDARHLGTHILMVGGLVVAALRLLQGDGCLLHLGGGIGGIHRVEHSALLHDIALLKAAGQHLAGHQRFDAVSIGRLQRTSAAERVGDIPGLRHCFCIGSIHVGGLCTLGLQQPPAACQHHDGHRHQPLPVLLGKGCCTTFFGCSRCVLLRVGGLFRLVPDHSCRSS